MAVDLSSYSVGGFDRGASRIRELIWLLVSLILFRMCPVSLSPLKCAVLRAFGAQVGRRVTIRSGIQPFFPAIPIGASV